MIDWDATIIKHGYSCLPRTKRPKVVCVCDECGKKRDITIRIKSQVIDGQKVWLCPSCVKLKESGISSRMKRQWGNDNYRIDRSKSSKELWQSTGYRARHNMAVVAAMKSVDMHSILVNRYANSAARDIHRKISIALWKDDNFRSKVASGVQKSAVYNGAPSSLHAVLSGYLDDLNLEYSPEYAIGPYNFDFCLHLAKPLLIEINGDYWHNRADVVARDARKASYISNLSDLYDFMVIWEFEFYTKGRVVDRICTSLGLNNVTTKDFEFSDVIIKTIDTKDARIFLSQYHYSGSLGRGGTKFGAYLGDMLIAVGVYSPVGRKETATRLGYVTRDVLEVSRFCIHPNYHRRNFASWLLSRFNKLIDIKCIVAFADTTFGHDGTIYKASNFVFDGIVKPTYWYVDSNGWVMHKKTLYEHARSLRMTENEFAQKYDYKKIFGAEKNRYILVKHAA